MGAPDIGQNAVPRPIISYSNFKFWHSGSSVRVVLRKDKIMVGCTDITPDAAKKLLSLWE